MEVAGVVRGEEMGLTDGLNVVSKEFSVLDWNRFSIQTFSREA
jgi:hypothetical protein